MDAKIYRPTKNAMQSGMGGTKFWLLEFTPKDRRFIEPLMGWTGSRDTRRQLFLKFESSKEAEAYAKRQGLSYEVIEPEEATLKIQAYSDNFQG